MNKKLVFSWGHIVALLACIALSYTAFVGLCYYTGGYFMLSGIIVAIIDVLVIVSFIGAQQFKIWDGNFSHFIIWERWLLFFMAPLSLVIAMIPVNHFLLLADNQDRIVTQFTSAVDTAKMVFEDYEMYANRRVQAINRTYKPQADEELERSNAKRALKLQLQGQNYDTIRNTALDWIDNKVGTPSIYNILVLGNINAVNKAFKNWNQQLNNFSLLRLSGEPKSTKDFDMDNPHIVKSISMLEDLKTQYRNPYGLARNTIPIALLLVFLLLIPWLIQPRNTKSDYRIIGKKKAPEPKHGNFTCFLSKSKKSKGHVFDYNENDDEDDENNRKSGQSITI